ncbi:hypothetical protein Zm00014a_000458 [Zea mays]|uniref:Uncharacterized protein n=1 Tax=Zea mays TaxID=4577 RepID=A0A3L6E424_MAIZE|nr:hypothetical protein Zm00014a_000458 [Zea mays]
MELRNRLTELKRKTAVDKTEVEQASSDLKAKTVPLNLALVTLKKRRADAVAMHTNAMKVAQMNLMATTSDCMKMQSKSVKQLCRLFPMRRAFPFGYCFQNLCLAESNPSDHSSKLKRLPQNLQESVESLSADKVLHELIGDKLVTTAIVIRKGQQTRLKEKDLERELLAKLLVYLCTAQEHLLSQRQLLQGKEFHFPITSMLMHFYREF